MKHITLARDCAISTIALPHSGNQLLKTVAVPLLLRSIPRHGTFHRKKFVIVIPHDELVVLVVPLRRSPLTLFTIYYRYIIFLYFYCITKTKHELTFECRHKEDRQHRRGLRPSIAYLAA